jgi:hypothetical protein
MGSLVLTDTIVTSPFQPITLRQWYAGLAMQGNCIAMSWDSDEDLLRTCAAWAYRLADAMIEEGEK